MVVNKSKRSKNSSAAGQSLVFYSRGWHKDLCELIKEAKKEVIIVSPYIRRNEARLIVNKLSSKEVSITVITDISTSGLIGCALEIEALEILLNSNEKNKIIHLPDLHAKIYVADTDRAIVTSANLTASGIYNNYEYGVGIYCCTAVSTIRKDIDICLGAGERVKRPGLKKRKKALKTYFQKRYNEKKALQTAPPRFLKKQEETKKARQALDEACEFSVAFKRRLSMIQRNCISVAEEQRLNNRADKYRKSQKPRRDAAVLEILKQGPMTTLEIYEEFKIRYCYLCLDKRIVPGKKEDRIWKRDMRNSQTSMKDKRIKLENGKWSLIPY